MKKRLCGSVAPVAVYGKTRRCGRKAGHSGECQAPLGNGDTTFWTKPKEAQP